MKIHLIAIGGAAMHSLALELVRQGHIVSGSDDEIYEPSRTRLQNANILPAQYGWFSEKITPDIDTVVLGMHARADNPELLRAQELGLKIVSYPEYVYEVSKDKKRVVVAGSHGKTTTTSMIMHVLKFNNIAFDYLVGAQVTGFDNTVYLSDAPILVVEGDEYLASPIDRRPKMLVYRPHIAVITGVAWDHINVFPTYKDYTAQFTLLAQALPKDGALVYYELDEDLKAIAEKTASCQLLPYSGFTYTMYRGGQHFYKLTNENGEEKYFPRFKPGVFGQHNYANFNAAYLVCKKLGLTDEQFLSAVPSFKGAAKRLQPLAKNVWLDFAHAPSKVLATVKAVSSNFYKNPLVACLELHTFSSLNREFITQYKYTLNAAETAAVFYEPHTFEMKKMPILTPDEVREAFGHPNLHILNDAASLEAFIKKYYSPDKQLLLMSSGKFGGVDIKKLIG